jgi:hypothetical protein
MDNTTSAITTFNGYKKLFAEAISAIDLTNEPLELSQFDALSTDERINYINKEFLTYWSESAIMERADQEENHLQALADEYNYAIDDAQHYKMENAEELFEEWGNLDNEALDELVVDTVAGPYLSEERNRSRVKGYWIKGWRALLSFEKKERTEAIRLQVEWLLLGLAYSRFFNIFTSKESYEKGLKYCQKITSINQA